MQTYWNKYWQLFCLLCCLFFTYSLHAQGSAPLPPSHVRGKQVVNQFISQTDRINVVNWKAPTGGSTPVAYKIYRDADLQKLAAIIPATKKLQFKDHNRKKNHRYTYFLVSVDEAGQTSFPVIIVFKGSKVRVKQNNNPLVAIDIEPENPTIAKDFTVQFTAIGIFSDGTTQDITSRVKWTSSNSSVATISSKGLATGISAGTTEIKASLLGITDSVTLTVTNATLVSIDVTPVDPVLAKDFTLQFTAEGIFSDNTTEDLTHEVTWSSSDSSVATISQDGIATGLAAGTTQIEAATHGVTGLTTLRVTNAHLISIEVAPVNPVIAKNTPIQFTATGLFSDDTIEDLTTQVTWESSDHQVATISQEGLATPVNSGFADITATLQGITGTTILTVKEATLLFIEVIVLDPAISGFHTQLAAIGHFSDGSTEDLTNSVAWESADPNVARVSNEPGTKGLANCLHTGSTIVTATESGFVGLTTLTVSSASLVSIDVEPANQSLAISFHLFFTALGHFSDGTIKDITQDVTWESTLTSVAEISDAPESKGFATALGVDKTDILAVFPGIPQVTGKTSLTVTPAFLTSITITPANPTINDGDDIQFTATGMFNDGSTENLTRQVTWESSNRGVAEILNEEDGAAGLAFSINPGTTTIQATKNGISGFTLLTVNCLPVAITTPSQLSTALNAPASIQINTVFGAPPVVFEIIQGSLPLGLSFSSSGAITGTPTELSVSNFRVRATSNCNSDEAIKDFSLTVFCALPFPLGTVTPIGTVGVPYNAEIPLRGTRPITIALFNPPGDSLPQGLKIKQEQIQGTTIIPAAITGIPTQAGTFTFNLVFRNQCGSSVSPYQVTILPKP